MPYILARLGQSSRFRSEPATADAIAVARARTVVSIREASCPAPCPWPSKIAPHLPNLRRFARLLAGSQKAGDAAVARVLQAIVADPSLFPDLPPRMGLYQCFLNAFTTRLEDPAAQAGEIGMTAARSLAALPPQARQAFLLVSVEDFDRTRGGRRSSRFRRAGSRTCCSQANSEIGTPDRHRRADHRGRAADRRRPQAHPGGARPSRHLDRAHAQGCHEGGRRAEAGAGAGRHPAGGRQLGPRCGQRHPRQLHACRSSSSPPTPRSS